MADLLSAAKTQIGYAANTLKTDGNAALGHIIKAQGYLSRAAAPLAPAPATLDDEPSDPLSADPAVAQAQLLKEIGVAADADAATILGAATEEQARALALLGVFGVPGTFAKVDYSLFTNYYEPSSPPDEENGLQSWAPKPEWSNSGSAWADYLSHRP